MAATLLAGGKKDNAAFNLHLNLTSNGQLNPQYW
jgi:hypothetical protein